jgi:hypothetical protein
MCEIQSHRLGRDFEENRTKINKAVRRFEQFSGNGPSCGGHFDPNTAEPQSTGDEGEISVARSDNDDVRMSFVRKLQDIDSHLGVKVAFKAAVFPDAS